jgi:hypothetical protein
MSLDYDFTNVKDWETLHGGLKEEKDCTPAELHEYYKTTNLAWASMVVDLGDITEKNYVDFYIRTNTYQHLFGCFFFKYNQELDKSEPYFYTLEDIKSRIGFTTNVMDKPYSAFYKKVLTILQRDTEKLSA